MRTQINRRYQGGLLGNALKDASVTDWANVGTQLYTIGKDVFGKNTTGQVQYIPNPNTQVQQPYYPQQQPLQNPNTTNFSQYLPIAVIGLLGIGAVMAFKRK